MGSTGEDVLSELSRALVALGAITLKRDTGRIHGAQLNPCEHDGLQEHLGTIHMLLHQRLVDSGIEYDGIVSVPTGGDVYADELARRVGEVKEKLVPRLRLGRGPHLPNKITDSAGLPASSRILVVDDCVVGGATALAARDVLEEAGFSVAAFLFVVNFEMSGSRHIHNQRYPCLSVFNSTHMRRQFHNGVAVKKRKLID